MILIVEDGTGVPDANSYVSLEYADAYFENHPFHSDAWSEIATPKRTNLLPSGSRSLDQLMNWYGYPLYQEQALGWPRQQVWNSERLLFLDTDIIPYQVKNATCEMAYFLSKGDPFASSTSEGLDSLRLDVIELNFSNSTSKAPIPAAALTLLKGLGEYAYGGKNRKVLLG